jgi:hypothetical protein
VIINILKLYFAYGLICISLILIIDWKGFDEAAKNIAYDDDYYAKHSIPVTESKKHIFEYLFKISCIVIVILIWPYVLYFWIKEQFA